MNDPSETRTGVAPTEPRQGGASRDCPHFPPQPVEPRDEAKREVFEFAKMIVWFLLLFFGLRLYVIEGYEVQGPSMTPTLQDQERILVFKLPHWLSQFSWFGGIDAIRPGDIIVFKSPDAPDKPLVKRVIAEGPRSRGRKTVQAGQQDDHAPRVAVRYEDDRVYVNNRRLDEDYISEDQLHTGETHRAVDLTENEYYVLGDNRDVSKDSRAFGPIRDSQIVGKAILRFWPPRRFGVVR